MPIGDWVDLMPHTVAYQPKTGSDAYGKPTLGTATNYGARVSYRSKRVASRVTGQDVVSTTTVWINGTISALSEDDQFTLPDGSMPVIVSWELIPDEDGNHHTVVYFGGARQGMGGS